MNSFLGIFLSVFFWGNTEASSSSFFSVSPLFFIDPITTIRGIPPQDPVAFFRKSAEKTTSFLGNLKKVPPKNIISVIPAEETILNLWLFDVMADDFSWPIKIFEEKTKNVKIVPRVFSDEKIYLAALQNGEKTGELPDIALIPDGFFPELSESLEEAPLEFFSTKECSDFFFSFSCSAFTKKGDIFGLPLFVHASALLVNRDLFRDDRIALGDRPATNWDDFLENFSQFTIFQKDKIFLVLDSKSGGKAFSGILVQSEKTLSRKNLTSALENLKKFSQWKKLPEETKKIFERGDVAMIWGDFESEKAFALDSEMKKNKLRKSAIKIFPLPQILEENPRNLGKTLALVVPKKAKNPQLSWATLAFFSEEENLRAIAQRSGKRVAWKFFGPFDAEKTLLDSAFSPIGKTGGLEFSDLFSENGTAFFAGKLSAQEFTNILFPFLQ